MEALFRSMSESDRTIVRQFQPRILKARNGKWIGFYLYTTDDKRHRVMTRKERSKYMAPMINQWHNDETDAKERALRDLGKSVFTYQGKNKKPRCVPFIPIFDVVSDEWGLVPEPKRH